MRNKHYDKKHNHKLSKAMIVTAIAVVVVAVSSIVGVMANTVECTVVDGDNSYSFNMLSPETSSILSRAVEEGMEPVDDADRILRDENSGVVNIIRCREITVQMDKTYTVIPGYDGDTVEETLKNGEVEYPEGSEITPEAGSKIKGNTSITIVTEQEVSVFYNGKTTNVKLNGGTVADAVKKAGINAGKNDKIEPAAASPIKNGMKITVTPGYKLTITDNQVIKSIIAYGTTVKDALDGAKITLGPDDIMNVKPEDKLTDGMSIVVDRVVYKESTKNEVVEYSTVYEDTGDLNSGETQLKSEGVNGEKKVTYREKFVNGESAGKEAVSETIISEPVNEVVLSGTASQSGGNDYTSPPSGGSTGGSTFIDYNGNEVSYSNVLYGSGTAYCVPGGTTSLGWDVAVGIVAVNPDIIPYGTKMYIVADGIVYGYAVAGDTGGALMSGEALVDVYYDTLEDCYTWGRRDVTVYIL